ncbi:MAG: penicillin-binding transpeptidase domain-containing protein, partial [bacterium]|nr:penicillin-binding transpeptidase domain-containing protein [bacterium]
VRNSTSEVLAYVGSPDYFSGHNGNKFNSCALLRSPGSVLKPLLYARAVEAGLITPAKKLFDIPTKYRDFDPQNFSKTFLGPVQAREALARSLNVPAINLENELGEKGLKGLLRELYPYEKELLIEDSGLSLVLGAFPLSLEEVVKLFSSLARLGDYTPLKFYLEEEKIKLSRRKILDPRACHIIAEMLAECERPDLPLVWEFTPRLAKVAFKTGTSFGLRDAWACGYNPDYTIGVWIGNVDCRSSPFLLGIKKAAPVFINIFNYLTRDSDSWFKRPEGVSTRKICTLSGEKPGPYCKEIREDLYIPGISPEQSCRLHKKIIVDGKRNVEVCSSCLQKKDTVYTEKIVEYWPNEVTSYFRKAGMKCDSIPAHNPDCQAFFTKNKPVIISPSSACPYEIDKGMPLAMQKIRLKADVALDVEKVYWFRESQLVASGKPDEIFFLTPLRGESVISIVDSKGRSDSVKIQVY